MDLSNIAAHADDIAKIVAALITVGGAAFAVWKWILPGLKSVKRSFVQMEKIADIADAVIGEFRANGGSSLRDSVNRIENGLEAVRIDATRMDARQWALVASLRDPIFETDGNGNCVRANWAYLNLTGRQLTEVLGCGWEVIIAPEDRAKVFSEWEASIKKARSYEGEYDIISVDKTRYRVVCIARPFVDPKTNSILGYIGRFVSVTELGEHPHVIDPPTSAPKTP